MRRTVLQIPIVNPEMGKVVCDLLLQNNIEPYGTKYTSFKHSCITFCLYNRTYWIGDIIKLNNYTTTFKLCGEEKDFAYKPSSLEELVWMINAFK